MNRKNLLLTMLACLNCVHTTHVLEKTPVKSMHVKIDIDDLRARDQLAFFRFATGHRLKNLSMIKDALIETADIELEGDRRLKDKTPLNDPKRPLFEEVVNIRHDIVQDIKNLKLDSLNTDDPLLEILSTDEIFEEKLKERVESRKITGLNVNMAYYTFKEVLVERARAEGRTNVITRYDHPYRQALLSKYPQLFHPHANNYFVLPSLSRILDAPRCILGTRIKIEFVFLEQYPDMAEQAWDLLKINWALDLNDMISSNNLPNTLGGVLELLDAKGTKAGQKVKEAVLGQIRKNLLGEDQDLKEKTTALLAKDPVLKKMVRKVMRTNDLMPLVKTMKHKQQTQGSFKKSAR